MTRYKLDGSDFPIDPLTKRWRRPQIATGGTAQSIYAAFWQVELTFPVLKTDEEIIFFSGKWLAGGLHTATLAHPKTGVMTGFTGVNIEDFSYDYGDIDSDGWAEAGARMTLGHINLSATGTA